MSSTPQIRFLGGIGSIGGTKIAVQEGEYRVVFDFGLNYAPGGDFWGHKLEPRTGAARLRDMIALGYVPAADGLYKPDYAATAGLKPGGGDKTHVFISHLHLDHMAVVDLLADDVPVWMHEDSLRLFRAVATTGEDPPVPVGARPFTWGQTIQVGPIKVTPVAVDHDIPGACGLLIETSAGTVVYTGDLRLHGPQPELIDAFMKAARATNPRILLIEGTRLGEQVSTSDRPPTRKELEVPGAVVEHLRETTGLALITLYPRNTLRTGNLARAVKEAGRTLVLSPETAHLYASMGGDLREVAIYKRHQEELAEQAGTLEGWICELYRSGAAVLDAEAIRANQTQYLLQLFYWDLNELVDLQPAPGSICIHCNGEPLGPFDPAYELFVRWLNHFGIELRKAYSTGHAGPEDLEQMITGIQPQVLMPIHTRLPELMQVAGISRELPEEGVIYEIATGKRIG